MAICRAVVVATALFLPLPRAVLASNFDADAADALVGKSGCKKCHAIDKEKNGPPYRKVAENYKGKTDAEDKLFVHMTTNPKVKYDEKEESHASLKTKDEAEIRNVIRWILSL